MKISVSTFDRLIVAAIGDVASVLKSVMLADVIEVTAAPTAIVANEIEFTGAVGATGEAAGVPAITEKAT